MANLFRCAGGGETLNCIAKPFDPTETYTKNDVVLYNNLLYICTSYGVTGEWDSTEWQQTTLEELSGTNPNIFYGIEWLEDEYDSTLEYNTDDTCMHAGLLYICLEDGVTGEWDSTKWKRTYLLDCTKLNSNLGGYDYTSERISATQNGTKTISVGDNGILVITISGTYELSNTVSISSVTENGVEIDKIASADGIEWSDYGFLPSTQTYLYQVHKGSTVEVTYTLVGNKKTDGIVNLVYPS